MGVETAIVYATLKFAGDVYKGGKEIFNLYKDQDDKNKEFIFGQICSEYANKCDRLNELLDENYDLKTEIAQLKKVLPQSKMQNDMDNEALIILDYIFENDYHSRSCDFETLIQRMNKKNIGAGTCRTYLKFLLDDNFIRIGAVMREPTFEESRASTDLIRECDYYNCTEKGRDYMNNFKENNR